MLAYTIPIWLQTTFDTLTGLFDWVGLNTNVRKTVGMVCHPCRAVRVWADKAHNQKMTGVERNYKEIQRERVSFPKCGK